MICFAKFCIWAADCGIRHPSQNKNYASHWLLLTYWTHVQIYLCSAQHSQTTSGSGLQRIVPPTNRCFTHSTRVVCRFRLFLSCQKKLSHLRSSRPWCMRAANGWDLALGEYFIRSVLAEEFSSTFFSYFTLPLGNHFSWPALVLSKFQSPSVSSPPLCCWGLKRSLKTWVKVSVNWCRLAWHHRFCRGTTWTVHSRTVAP